MKASFFNVWVCGIAYVAIMTSSLHAQDKPIIAGDKCNWIIEHYGLSSEKYLGTNSFGSPVRIIAEALKSAKAFDKKQFETYFSDPVSDVSRDSLYNEWQLYSRLCPYIIVDEAVIDNKNSSQPNTNTEVAISLVPFGLVSSFNKNNILPEPKASVVFLIKTNQVWKISLAVEDNKLSDYLMNQASQLIYHADSNVFTSSEDLKKSQTKSRDLREAEIIRGMQNNGASVAQINGIKENFSLENGDLRIVETNWLAWKRHYNFHELAPQVVYDVRDPWSVDFSTPLSAQRSYRHAIYIGDAKTLYQFADETGKKELHRFVGDENVKKVTYEVFPKITKYTVLFTAITRYDENDYALVFFRAQENTNPTNGRVAFQADIFKRTQQGYVFTGDFDPSSTFGNPGRAANVGFMFLCKYPQFYQIASKSELPEYFYKIDE
jgi:hypothetical protein